MITAEDVIRIYSLLLEHEIPVWLTGGWGIDALLGKHTRPHKDLDVIMLFEDIAPMCTLLEKEGFAMKELWSENLWAEDSKGNKIATAFYLEDADGRQFDVHAVHIDPEGNALPAWNEAEDFVFKKEDLESIGLVAGHRVQCITPESQIYCHTGYELPEEHLQDMALLSEKFDVDFPPANGSQSLDG